MIAANEIQGRTKRSLILAGGGIKVAFQAGVLQVWLDMRRETVTKSNCGVTFWQKPACLKSSISISAN
jgi:predicted patatin/cPLA2 family phospholipase